MYYRIILLLIFCYSTITYGQSIISSPKEQKLYSVFNCYDLAKSYSERKDSIRASHFFLEINPYYFICEKKATPQTIESIMSRFRLTKRTQMAYRKKFIRVYNDTRSDVFLNFCKMLREDQSVRDKIDRCTDSSTCNVLREAMRTTDSAHFLYLRNYIIKHGWPSLENGSLYTQTIALHDHNGYDYLLPIVKTAVYKGLVRRSI